MGVEADVVGHDLVWGTVVFTRDRDRADAEDDPTLQDLVLAIHHACTQTLTETGAFKIIEDHNGVAVIGSLMGMR